MININGKYFRKFTPRELFTEYIFSIMKQGKTFMMFPDNKQILIEEEVDEWNRIHGFMDDTERIMYHQYGTEGYIAHYSSEITNVFVPLEMLKWSYERFISQCEEDVNYRLA